MTKKKKAGKAAEVTVEEENEISVDEPTPVADEESAEEPKKESELERLERELEEANAQAAEYLDGWQRAQAEFANYRKRQEAARQQQTQMSNVSLIAKVLPVMDDLERALQTLPPGLIGLTWLDGVLLIKRKLEAVLESEGVTPVETQGQTFDPLYHEAVTYEEVEGYQDGQVIDQMQRGYMLGDRVIRPAMVRVARAPAEPADTEPDEAEQEDAEPE